MTDKNVFFVWISDKLNWNDLYPPKIVLKQYENSVNY